MRFRDCQEAIQLRVDARERQAACCAIGLGNCSIVPEPATRKLVVTISPRPVITDCVLVITDGCYRAELAGKSAGICAGDSTKRRSATALATAWNRKLAAIETALQVENIDCYGIDLCG